MTSEIYELEGSFFSDPFSPFNDSSSTIDILQVFQEHNNYNYTPFLSSTSSPPLTTQENFDTTPFDELDQITSSLQHSTSSPPSNQLENLSLNQMGISVTSSNDDETLDFSSLDVKIEEGQQRLPLYDHNNYYGGPHNNALKMMQRSYSSNSFQQAEKPNINGIELYQPKFDGLIESFPNEVLTSHDHSFSSTHMRRASSTGDLQSPNVSQTSQRLSTSPLATKSTSFMEEANFKVGRYNAEERKDKISRYRAKRTQRNFNKTIKYACRKTLADNRPRIRGRFARNDEPGDQLPKTTPYNPYSRDEDELWMEQGLYEEGDHQGRGQFFSTTYDPSIIAGQFHHFSFIQN
uniref:uncharacterized protein LOC122594252 n=1 Tax=Erigeron canadensis TaxID=72917 RepID=UPI001CB8A6BE|nr:uncharacterized protein LOC122594252 [Erigeron canadensis]